MSSKVAVDRFPKEFGAHIRALRIRHGMSQEEFASRAALHVTYVSGIESGRRNPTVKVLEKFAAALNLPVRDLFDFLAGKSSTPSV